MTSGQRRNAHYVNVVLHSLTGSLGRSLEQRSHIYVETTVRVTGSDHFSATVVSVLTHLSDHDTRLTALFLSELLAKLASFLEVCVFLSF